jgi:tetratricopeptide (TPR) repeat protein
MPDTEAARDDMRWARKYIDEYHGQPGPLHLDMALRYIRRAREKDPYVTLKAVGTDKKSLFDWTLSAMEGEIFGIQGVNIVNDHFSKDEDFERAIYLLQQSIQLLPMPVTYKALAFAYNRKMQRPKADALFREAAQRFPDDFSIRQAIDTHEAYPTVGVKPTNFKVIFVVLAIICLALAFWGYKISEDVPHPIPYSANDIVIAIGLLARFLFIVFALIAFFVPSGKTS